MNSLINFIDIYGSSIPDIFQVKPYVAAVAGSCSGAMDALFDSVDTFIDTHPVYTSMICLIIIVGAMIYIPLMLRWLELSQGKSETLTRTSLTPTQKFILAASAPTAGNIYKCVIDIWDTHLSPAKAEKAKTLFEWGWGPCTCENAKNVAEDCLDRGHNSKYIEYCDASVPPEVLHAKYNDFELNLLEEMKRKYPEQGMLGWDLVRALSVVGGAYMAGVMPYEEAVRIAFRVCKIMQENFSSWDDMVGSYTLGYQLWRGKRKKDRLKYYKRLKRQSWIYKISWDTTLKEDEL